MLILLSVCRSKQHHPCRPGDLCLLVSRSVPQSGVYSQLVHRCNMDRFLTRNIQKEQTKSLAVEDFAATHGFLKCVIRLETF